MVLIFGLLGIVLGVAIGLFIVMGMIKKSNDFGDSYGSTTDYEGMFQLVEKEDKVSKRRYEAGYEAKDMSGFINKLKDFFE